MTTDRSRVLHYIAAGLAMAALAGLGMFYFASGLLAPLWAVIVLNVIWLSLVITGILWFRRHPLRVLVLPVIAALIWYGALTAGEQLLGWTA